MIPIVVPKREHIAQFSLIETPEAIYMSKNI